MLLTCCLFVAVILAVIRRPGGLPVAVPATVGALAMVVLGWVDLADLRQIVSMTWSATLTLVALLLLTRVLDEAGLFAWSAASLAHRFAHSRRKAWFAFAAMSVATTMLLANDGSIVILTPILAEMAGMLAWSRQRSLPFIWASGFLIDAASTPLVMGNLTNLLAADARHLSFAAYWQMNAPGFVGALIGSMAILWLVFGRQLDGQLEADALPAPETFIRDRSAFRLGWLTLGALVTAYAVNQIWPMPVVAIVGAAAAVMVAVAAWRWPRRVGSMVRQAPWDIIVFAMAMFVVVWGAGKAGWSDALLHLWLPFAGSAAGTVLVVGITISLLSAVANNLPALLIALLVIPALPAAVQPAATAAALIGSNIGCKLTPYGSLATLLWLDQLRRHGVTLSWGEVLKMGCRLTPPAVAAALASLVLLG
jgi:arsenical pump membrane protein